VVVVIAVIFSAISAYFLLADHYEHVHETLGETVGITPSLGLAAALFICAVMIFVIGLAPSVVLF